MSGPAGLPERLYRIHGERDFLNPAWDDASARILVARLSPFRDVERSTPHQFLYREIRDAAPGAYVDFCFFPVGRDRAWRSANGVPWMLGLASGRGAAEFDAVLVSNAYTLELVNLAPSLERSGLPASRRERERLSADPAACARFPLVVLGGSNAMAAGSVIEGGQEGDSFPDGMFFGEGEGRAGRLAVELAAAARLPIRERAAALDAIAARTEGFWRAGSSSRVRQARATGDSWPVAAPPAIAGEESGTLRLEITRGCPGFCTFCFEGWERKPYRERSPAGIMEEAARLKAATGADTVELASYNFNAHSDIVEIIRRLNALFLRVNFMSQRADLLASVGGLPALETAADKRAFTLGVEGISARARAYFNKELSTAQALSAFRKLAAEDPREISLFYVLSGFEDKADLDEFAGFAGSLKAIADARPRAPRVIFSVGALVRMPFTPLGREALVLDPEPYRAIAARMKEETESRGFEFRGPDEWDEYRLSQVLALAPPEAFSLLRELAARGHCYDRGLSAGAWKAARSFLDRNETLGEAFTARKGEGWEFPLAFVEPAVSPAFLEARFAAASAAVEDPSCFEGGLCAGCGACADDAERGFLTGHSITPAGAADIAALRSVMERKRKPPVTWMPAELPEELAEAHPRHAAARFAAGLMAAVPELVPLYLSAEDAFLKSADCAGRLPRAWGPTWYRLSWFDLPDPALLAAAGLSMLDHAPEPGALRALAVLRGASPAAADSVTGAFLQEMSMPFTLVKDPSGSRFSVSEKGRKKRNVLSARRFPGAGGTALLELDCGPKFDLSRLGELCAARDIGLVLRVEPRPS